jgi:UrcA family protein
MGTKKQTSPKLASAYATTSPSVIATAFTVAMAVAALALAPVAMAEPDVVRPVSATVSYADLDLSTEAGARTMLQRIRFTAREMCGSEPVHSPLTPRAPTQFRNCVIDAVDSAVAGLGAPLVASLNNTEAEQALTVLASR